MATETLRALWQERLESNPDVSEISLTVRETSITVVRVVELIVDGWTWVDILRRYPQLTDADIQACLAYTVEQVGEGAT